MDILTRQERSERMSLIRGKNTAPEMVVRRLVHKLGFRYRLHTKKLPGRPDLSFRSRRKVIFVHGCFWHRHPSPLCKLARMPKSNLDFWKPKLEATYARDQKTLAKLAKLNWAVMIVWECELKDRAELEQRLIAFLEGNNARSTRLA